MNISVAKLKRIINEEVSMAREAADDLDPRYEDSDEAAHKVNMALEEIGEIHEELWGHEGIPRETMEALGTAMETINANWTAMTGLTIDEGGTRPMQEAGEEPNAQEVHDAWVDVGKFLAKLYNQGQDELAADLDKILTRFQAAGAIPRKAGVNNQMDSAHRRAQPVPAVKEADEGGPGVHDIMNLPEPEAVESSGNPKEDAIRQIVATSSMAKVDGQKLDLFSAGAIVAVLDALGPENKAHYLKMPVAKMADMAFKLTQ
jgi:hypothetical protein